MEIQQEAKNKKQRQKSQEDIAENGPFQNAFNNINKDKPVTNSRRNLLENKQGSEPNFNNLPNNPAHNNINNNSNNIKINYSRTYLF